MKKIIYIIIILFSFMFLNENVKALDINVIENRDFTPLIMKTTSASDTACRSLLGDPEVNTTPAYWIQFALDIMKYVAIIALLVLSTSDFFQAVVQSDKDAMKKAITKTGKRFLYAIMIFFLPIIINVLMKLLGAYGTCNIG